MLTLAFSAGPFGMKVFLLCLRPSNKQKSHISLTSIYQSFASDTENIVCIQSQRGSGDYGVRSSEVLVLARDAAAAATHIVQGSRLRPQPYKTSSQRTATTFASTTTSAPNAHHRRYLTTTLLRFVPRSTTIMSTTDPPAGRQTPERTTAPTMLSIEFASPPPAHASQF